MAKRTLCNHIKKLALCGLLLLDAPFQTWAATAEDYYQNGKSSMTSGDLQGALTYFDQLRKLYPHDPYANQALIEMGYAYYKLADSDAAINMLDSFIAEQPDHPHLPYAYYLAGLTRYDEATQMFATANTDQGNARIAAITDQALGYFGLLIDRYPGSQYVADARQKSTHLLELLMLRRNNTQVAETTPKNEAISSDGIKDANWLLGQPPSYFTLQLTADPKPEELQQLIKTNELKDKAIIYELRNENGSVYVLLYGVYLNKRAAMEAGSLLPDPILRRQPWVREVSSAQIDIRQSRLAMVQNSSKPKATDISEPVPTPKPTETVQPVDKSQPAAVEITAAAAAVIPSITPVIQTAPVPAPAPAAPAATANKPETSAPAKTNTTSGPRREEWLLSQNPRYYTLQVTAVSQEKSAQQFIRQHQLGDEAAYFRNIRDNKEFFSVTYGSYPTKQAAAEAAKTVAESAGAQPWVRKFSDVHSAIRSTK
ncbi:MAG: outer membrane protein assembly factor BamD [Gammaproteobacteria bacterium]|nr:outer membrane protein assembly factor BamD [Gammaproteobacteria bacterium]